MSPTSTDSKLVDVNLPDDIFAVQVNVPLIHQVVVAQLAAARQGTSATKTRGNVRGGGAKPYRQKGTGRARQGSTRAPQFAGGGVVHGPQPRTYVQKTPKKMKAAALRGALSDRARNGRVHVVDGLLSDDEPSTSTALAALAGVTEARHVLVVLDREDVATWKSLRNVDRVHLLAADQLNTYDVLVNDDVVFTKPAYDSFITGPATGRGAKASASSAELPDLSTHELSGGVPSLAPAEGEGTVEEAATDTAPYGEGSHAPLGDDEAPAGYPIKGNADSMKYHQPDGRWFDQTVAEVWFATAEDAERAGFTEAGRSAKSSTDTDTDGDASDEEDDQ